MGAEQRVALTDDVSTTTGWDIVDTGVRDDRIVTIGSNFLVGDGHLGYRGTLPHHRAEHFVGCVVTDTYDMADGKWRELCTVPNGCFVDVSLGGQPARPDGDVTVSMDLRRGAVRFEGRYVTDAGLAAAIVAERHTVLDTGAVVVQRVEITPEEATEVSIVAGIDTVVWSLNGEHFASGETGITTSAPGPTGAPIETRILTWRGRTVERDLEVLVEADICVDGALNRTEATEVVDGLWADTHTGAVAAGATVAVHSTMAVDHGNRTRDTDPDRPLGGRTMVPGPDDATAMWARFWDRADVRIDGDPLAQAALRFSILHNRIATPTHSDRLPIGARGLSCQAYQGAAFWDQEMFNLWAFLFTDPTVARNLLTYRWRTLDGARRKAARLGYRGAYFAWISGDTGDELCPDFFFEDVLTGRPIRNHFNVWQMHISPDIARAVWRYWDATADLDFLVDHGAELTAEIARFLHSFVVLDEANGHYEIVRLLGPDEWHENVDNNVYTSHLTRLALTHALDIRALVAEAAPDRLAELDDRLGITADEVDGWRRVLEHLFHQPTDPESLLMEQFDGFFALEDCRPDDLRPRLLDPGEYWGWPNGVAVHTQVSKQPDVVQLFGVDPSFPLDVQRANYDYYEPRCAHGSSLSHSVHATVACRLADLDPAYLEQAHDYFMRTATIDLTDVSHGTVGGTFIGGMHTAANAGAYQTAVLGFGGVDVVDDRLVIDPRLPAAWEGLAFSLEFRGNRVGVDARAGSIRVTAASENAGSMPLNVTGTIVELDPGADFAT